MDLTHDCSISSAELGALSAEGKTVLGRLIVAWHTWTQKLLGPCTNMHQYVSMRTSSAFEQRKRILPRRQ